MRETLQSRWRARIHAIDPANEQARTLLNQAYSELMAELRELLHRQPFSRALPNLRIKAAREATDPETSAERLWELIDRYPVQVASHPIWAVGEMGLRRLAGQDIFESVSSTALALLAQQADLTGDVQRSNPYEWMGELNLAYTALLDADHHPYPDEELIRELYRSPAVLEPDQITWLLGLSDHGAPLASMSDGVNRMAWWAEDQHLDKLLNLWPVFVDGEDLLDATIVFQSSSSFLDASPVAELLQRLPKTKLVDRGVHVQEDSIYPVEVYQRLALHRNSGPKSEVAGCHFAPCDTLVALAQNNSKEIAYPLASNPTTPMSVLRHLKHQWSGWGSKTVSRYVDQNKAFVNGEAWQLMEMGRLHLEADQRKKTALLSILACLETSPDVAETLRKLLLQAFWSSTRIAPSRLRLLMIRRGWVSHDLLMAAAWSWHWLERLAVAQSPLAPPAALRKLRRDGLPFVRHAAEQPR